MLRGVSGGDVGKKGGGGSGAENATKNICRAKHIKRPAEGYRKKKGGRGSRRGGVGCPDILARGKKKEKVLGERLGMPIGGRQKKKCLREKNSRKGPQQPRRCRRGSGGEGEEKHHHKNRRVDKLSASGGEKTHARRGKIDVHAKKSQRRGGADKTRTKDEPKGFQLGGGRTGNGRRKGRKNPSASL